VIFSLEMSKTEITMRLLSAEAGIRLSQMRVGVISIPAPYLPPDGGLPPSGTALAVAAARSSGS